MFAYPRYYPVQQPTRPVIPVDVERVKQLEARVEKLETAIGKMTVFLELASKCQDDDK